MALNNFQFILFLADVLLVDDEIIVFKSGSECKFYISGPVDEVRTLC